jgi:hypothetical protein
LHFYAEIWGFFESPNFDGVETTGRDRHLLAPEKAQIGSKGSKPRDAPQPRPVLGNPAKKGTFVILNRREVLAKNASGSDMKNLTIASRGDKQIPNWQVHAAFFLRCSYELFRCYDVA